MWEAGDLANVASPPCGHLLCASCTGNNPDIGKLIADAMAKVGRQGVVTMEESKTAEDNLVFVEGMQFDRGYYRCAGGCGQVDPFDQHGASSCLGAPLGVHPHQPTSHAHCARSHMPASSLGVSPAQPLLRD